jgi:N-acetylmuramoyl-L-alanine amidase
MYLKTKEQELLFPWQTLVALLMIILVLQFTILRPEKVQDIAHTQNIEQVKPIEVAPIKPISIATKAAPVKPKFLRTRNIEEPVAVSPTTLTTESPTKLATVAPQAEESPREEAPPKFLAMVESSEKLNYSDKDLFCMAKNIYHEAGSEPTLGKYAVAQVTINRMKSPMYKGTVCSVVFEPYQFSWANYHGRRWTTPKGEKWIEAKRIARDVLENGKRIHGMSDALFYHATYVRPYWASRKDKLIKIGLHIFYEPRV